MMKEKQKRFAWVAWSVFSSVFLVYASIHHQRKMQKIFNQIAVEEDISISKTNNWNAESHLNAESNYLSGVSWGCQTNTFPVVSVSSNSICIGRNAKTTNSNELVVRFKDGTEFRIPLPEGKEVDI